MIPYADCHMHTPLCGHAIGAPEEYVKQAIKMGLKEIGFSDHAPMAHKPMPDITMSFEDLPKYNAMIEEIRKLYSFQISIKIALESDFLPGYESKTKAIIDSYPYDYIIGSVHFIDDWAFDDPDTHENWQIHDVDETITTFDIPIIAPERSPGIAYTKNQIINTSASTNKLVGGAVVSAK